MEKRMLTVERTQTKRNQPEPHEVYERDQWQRYAKLQNLHGIEQRSLRLELVTGHLGSHRVVAAKYFGVIDRQLFLG